MVKIFENVICANIWFFVSSFQSVFHHLTKLLHWFVKVVTWVCQSCLWICQDYYMDLSSSYIYNVFLALCQIKPRWSLNKMLMLVDAHTFDVELSWLCLSKILQLQHVGLVWTSVFPNWNPFGPFFSYLIQKGHV